MLKIGEYNQLVVIDVQGDTAVLDGGPYRPVRLPLLGQHCDCQLGDQLEVFVYLDAAGKLVATCEKPRLVMGQVAWLEVVEVNQVGAFFDWGLPKDLFVPFAEQQYTLHAGDMALVKVYLDNQNRIAGTTRIDRWVKDDAADLKVGEQVSLTIAGETELGFKAVVNHRCWGLLYHSELFRRLTKGQVIDGYVKQIRADNKVDLTLSKPGYAKSKIDGVAEQIIAHLEQNEGLLLLTDKSPPQAIYTIFGVSKKVFKQALGSLYKQRRISIDKTCVRLLSIPPVDSA